MITLNLKDKLLKKFASNFVDIYEKEGRYRAGVWAELHIGEFAYQEAQSYIQKEFENRDYTFDNGGDVA